MKLDTFEIETINEDGTSQKRQFKSIRDMSLKTGISYHNLKVIYERQNKTSEKYKNTSVNNLSKTVKINRIAPVINLSSNLIN